MQNSNKRILTVVLVAFLCSFSGCTQNNTGKNDTQNNKIVTNTNPVNTSGPTNQSTVGQTESLDLKCSVIGLKEGELKASKSEGNANFLRETSIVPRNDDGKTIDVLVVHTTKAKEHFGNVEAVKQAVNNARDQANTTFRNSQIDLQIRISDVVEIPEFVETNSFSSDLDRIAFGGDGNRTRQLRDTNRADLVSVIRYGGDMGGLAYQLQSPIGDSEFDFDQKRGFSMIKSSCVALSYYCFTHEIGHNLGAAHEPGVDDPDIPGLYTDSRGYCFDPPNDNPDIGNIGTMMSYCGADNRIFHFSNPDVLYQGVPTGKADERNSARAIRDAKNYVANYRKSTP